MWILSPLSGRLGSHVRKYWFCFNLALICTNPDIFDNFWFIPAVLQSGYNLPLARRRSNVWYIETGFFRSGISAFSEIFTTRCFTGPSTSGSLQGRVNSYCVLFQPCLALLPSDYLLICKEFMGKNVHIISDAPLKRIEWWEGIHLPKSFIREISRFV